MDGKMFHPVLKEDFQVLWTDYLSPQMIMFVALAVIDKHRQVILNDLHQFDEVLKVRTVKKNYVLENIYS